jgi:hypothetical protein
MFARYVLGDLFIHGIGGAKYDELGDEVAHEFFGLRPPEYLTLSMTLWLGLGQDPASVERLRALDQEVRDLTFNPDRHLPDPIPPDVAAWVEAKRGALAGPTATRRQRRDRLHAIRRCNEALQPAVASPREALLAERARIAEGLKRNAVARNREYAFVLHSQSRLRAAQARVTPGSFQR